MNVWRWLGISLFFLGTVCLLGTTKLSVLANDKDKKTTTDEKKKTTPEEKKTTPEDKKKTKEEKPEEKKPEAAKGDLVFKAFNKGAPTFYQELKTVTEQTMKVQNQDVKQKQEQTFIIQWIPSDPDKENYVVKQNIVGVDMSINIGGNNIKYDSRLKNPKNPMTDFFEKLTSKDSGLTFTISPELKVVKVDGGDKFIKGLSDINPQMTNLLKAILDDAALKQMAEPTWWAFPKGGVIPKESWKQESKLDLGPIGVYKSTFTFTHKKTEGTKDTIGIETSLTYEAPAAAQRAGLPFIIHDAKLTSTSGKGEAIFDRTKGRFESTTIDMTLKGNLVIEVGNMKTTVDLEQTQKSTSKTLDENPFKAAS